jgi:hypothetical protein
MRYILVILFILIIQNVYATCSDDQIDINSAPKQELVKIIYIGEVRAGQLIELRPFESIEDLIRIKGIGEVYLSKIKEQGLACVNEIKEDEEEVEEIEEIEKVKEAENNFKTISEDNTQKKLELEIIKLNTKNIKTEKNATYGFVIFCVLLGFLFAIRKIKLRKNEFD